MIGILKSGLMLCVFSSISSLFANDIQNAETVFNQRILPIFRSEQPSSCVQCHLSSVDLKNYILPSSEKTFLSLRDQGLVNLENPEKSKILDLIQMGEKDADEGAKLIHEKLREQEYKAFAAWIHACCSNESLRDLPKLSSTEYAMPSVADEVIRHNRKSRVVDSFARHIFSQRMRCFPCHTPEEIDSENPRHMAAIKTQKKLKEIYGDNYSRLELFKKTPEETLDFLIESSRHESRGRLAMLNLKDPEKSLLVLKPTSKLPVKKDDGSFAKPSSSFPVTHMGGLKMHPHDQSYKAFIAWIEDYAKVTSGEYQSIDDLPVDNWIPTQLVLRLTNAPDEWSVGMPVQIFLHTKNDSEDKWQDQPVAFTQGTVTSKGMVNGALFLFADSTAQDEAKLRPGDQLNKHYQIQIFVDREGLLQDDPTLLLNEESFVGATELNITRWREGFRFAKTVSADSLKK